LPIVVLFVQRVSRGERTSDFKAGARFLLFFSFAPIGLALILSYLFPFSIWGTRHLIVCIAPYILLAAAAIMRLNPLWLRATVMALLGCWLLVTALGTVVRREGRFIWCAWDDLAGIAAREDPQVSLNVYAFEDLVAYHVWFGLERHRGTRPTVAVIKDMPGVVEDPAYFLPRRFDGVVTRKLDEIKDERIWVTFRDTSFDELRPPMRSLIERGYRVERSFETSAQGQRAFLVLMSKN
jgi:hypothetical protein